MIDTIIWASRCGQVLVAVDAGVSGRLLRTDTTGAQPPGRVGVEADPFGGLRMQAHSPPLGPVTVIWRAVPSAAVIWRSVYGIGALKAPWLPLARTDAERALFARIRSALDPSATLNPNVLPR
jgi:hypothetical protein